MKEMMITGINLSSDRLRLLLETHSPSFAYSDVTMLVKRTLLSPGKQITVVNWNYILRINLFVVCFVDDVCRQVA